MAGKILRIETHQSVSRISSRAATPPIDQSEPSARATSDQSKAARAQPICYKSSCRRQFVSPVSPRTEDSAIDATNSVSRNTSSNSIDFLENCARTHSSSFLRRVTSNLVCLIWSGRRILKRGTRQCKHRRYGLIRAIYAVVSLCCSPTIAAICCSIMESPGMESLWFVRALMQGPAHRSDDIEPDSDD